MTAGQAWIAVIGGIAVYEFCSREGELLSEGVDRARERHWSLNVAVHGVVVVTAAHLLRLMPPRLDPFSAALRFVR